MSQKRFFVCINTYFTCSNDNGNDIAISRKRKKNNNKHCSMYLWLELNITLIPFCVSIRFAAQPRMLENLFLPKDICFEYVCCCWFFCCWFRKISALWLWHWKSFDNIENHTKFVSQNTFGMVERSKSNRNSVLVDWLPLEMECKSEKIRIHNASFFQ